MIMPFGLGMVGRLSTPLALTSEAALLAKNIDSGGGARAIQNQAAVLI